MEERYLIFYRLLSGETPTFHRQIMNIKGLLDIEHPSQIENIELQILTNLHKDATLVQIIGITLLNKKENVANITGEKGAELQQP